MKSELRGWPVEFETFPLSFSEYCDFAGLRRKSHLESEKAKMRAAFDVFNRMGGMPEIALTESMMNEDSPEGRKTRKREIDGLVAAAESLKCENLTIVTHDEDSVVRDRGHDIRVVPAWKWCLAK